MSKLKIIFQFYRSFRALVQPTTHARRASSFKSKYKELINNANLEAF